MSWAGIEKDGRSRVRGAALRSTAGALGLCAAILVTSGPANAQFVCDSSGGGASATGAGSFACGTAATANGDNATATGVGAFASGDNAAATGAGAVANGDNTTATGVGAAATAVGGTATGYSAQASGTNSTATGTLSTASGVNCDGQRQRGACDRSRCNCGRLFLGSNSFECHSVRREHEGIWSGLGRGRCKCGSPWAGRHSYWQQFCCDF